MEQLQHTSQNSNGTLIHDGCDTAECDEQAAAEHPPTAEQPETAQLDRDETFWRDAISTWQSRLQSRPEHPETLHYLKSCQAKLAEVLVLLGRPEEAAEQSKAVSETGRLVRAARSKGRLRSIRIPALGLLGFVAAAVILLLIPMASGQRERPREIPQQSDTSEIKRKASSAERNRVVSKADTGDRSRHP
ncbi:MAG: hypothetical protein H0W04_08020 [Chthoniobacterales bacterium]|nr:hypothetical protein [Chthoniobacterales bacterium]